MLYYVVTRWRRGDDLDFETFQAREGRTAANDRLSHYLWTGLEAESVALLVIDVPDHLDAHQVGPWLEENIHLVAGEPSEQTRPSAILSRPHPQSRVEDCTVAELLAEALERTRESRETNWAATQFESQEAIAREFSICATLIEDAITRHNKAVYMRRGIFAITDAERTTE